MEDTNEILQESGQLTIGDLALNYGFAVDFMTEVVQSHLRKKVLRAHLKGTTLYTESFVQREKARIRGVLSAITKPVFLPEIVSKYGFQDLDGTLMEMIDSGVLMGSLRGGSEFVPHVFIKTQRNNILDFYLQNGYLEYKRAFELQVARPYDFVRKVYPDAVALGDCVINPSIYEHLEGTLEVVINDSNWIDVRPLIPSPISDADASLLLSKCTQSVLQSHTNASNSNTHHFATITQIPETTFAFSKAFLERIIEFFTKDAAQKASKASQLIKQNGVKKSTEKRDFHEEEEAPASKRGKKGKKGKRGGYESPDEVNEVVAERSNTKKGGKKKDKKKESKKSSNKSKEKSENEMDSNIVPSSTEISNLIVSSEPSLIDEDEVCDSLSPFLARTIENIYTQALQKSMSSIHRGDAALSQQLHSDFELILQEKLVELILFQKSLQKIRMKNEDKVSEHEPNCWEIYLLDSKCVDLAYLLTCYVCQVNDVECKGFSSLISNENAIVNLSEMPMTQRSLSAEQIEVLSGHLSHAVSKNTIKVWTLATAGRRCLDDFMEFLQSNLDVILGSTILMSWPKLDRKRERKIIFDWRHCMQEKLRDVHSTTHTSKSESLHDFMLMLLLLGQQIYGVIFILPYDNSPAVYPQNQLQELIEFMMNSMKKKQPTPECLWMKIEECKSVLFSNPEAMLSQQQAEQVKEVGQTKDLESLDF